jgi:phosphatidylserine decarboxylase
MQLHKEGYKIIIITFLVLLVLSTGTLYLVPWKLLQIVLMASFVIEFIWTISFFRVPNREIEYNEMDILASADGKVVAIEEVTENEYFKDRRIMISVFMSPFNIHVNWYPISGMVKYTRYHKGKYLAAYNPKSSTDNERNTIVLQDTHNNSVLIRQIAGMMARRIISYARPEDLVKQGNEFGIIRFGSRVDFYIPLDAKVKVQIGDKVKAQKSTIASFK